MGTNRIPKKTPTMKIFLYLCLFSYLAFSCHAGESLFCVGTGNGKTTADCDPDSTKCLFSKNGGAVTGAPTAANTMGNCVVDKLCKGKCWKECVKTKALDVTSTTALTAEPLNCKDPDAATTTPKSATTTPPNGATTTAGGGVNTKSGDGGSDGSGVSRCVATYNLFIFLFQFFLQYL